MGIVINFEASKKELAARRSATVPAPASAFPLASHEVLLNNSARIGIANMLLFAKFCESGHRSIVTGLERLLDIYTPS